MKVFLGGTCNESNWRSEVEDILTANNIDFFNPVVDDWDEKAQAREIKEREDCEICLYTITPKMTGVYSIAEVIDDAHKRPEKVIFNVLGVDKDKKFNDAQLKSLIQVGTMVQRLGGAFTSGSDQVLAMIKMIQSQEPTEVSIPTVRHVTKAFLDMIPSIEQQFIQIENEEDIKGVPAIVKFTIQSDPVKEVGINGCQARDMLEYVKCLFESLNSKIPNKETNITIIKLEEALMWQDARTAERKRRQVEGTMEK